MQNTIKLLILIFVALIWISCSSQNDTIPPSEKIPVTTKKVTKRNVRIPIHSSGKLSLKSEMKLAFKTGGIIEDIFVDDGAIVKKGDLLAKLDVSEIEARVEQARSGHEKAQRDYERAQKLYTDNAATYEQLQNASTALDMARSQLKMAEFNLRHSSINAPAKGKILRRLAERNELVGSGMPIFLFGSLEDNWIIRVGITDREILQLQYGDSARVRFDAYPQTNFKAYVSQIAGAANSMTGTFDVELTLNAHGNKLISGFVGKVDIIPSKTLPFFIIPIEALVEADGDQGFVYSLAPSDTHVIKCPVQIGHVLGQEVAIISGLENVDAVITDGAPYLADGSQVEIVNNP